MDIVYLRDLRIPTVIGVFEWERRVRQIIAIDLDMAFDVACAARTDALADALDYKAVAKRLIGFVEASRFQLVETLAERIHQIEHRLYPQAVALHLQGRLKVSGRKVLVQ